MKRLKSLFRSMEPNTKTYVPMYNGAMLIYSDNYIPYEDYDPTYFGNDGISYRIESPNKLKQDCPIISVRIPTDVIFNDEITDKGGLILLKRLKYYFRQMDDKTETYSYKMPDGNKNDIYDGISYLHIENHEFPEQISDSTYWQNDIAYTLEKPDKLSVDKPIVKIAVPFEDISPELCGSPPDSNYYEALKAAAADYCLRAFIPYIDLLNEDLYNRSRPDNENGKYYIHRPAGEVLVRNSAYFEQCPQRDYEYLSGNSVRLYDDDTQRPPIMCLCLRIQVQLPNKKLKKAMTMLTKDLPETVELYAAELNRKLLNEAMALASKQYEIRKFLSGSDYAAFIADGSILPREKNGVAPLSGAIPFKSTPGDKITVGGITGMGIKRGVTVITGGGYSGKSTLLDAISAGIYNHCPGDGRELVICDDSAVSIAAEDGRCVQKLNISPFIKELPAGDTVCFSTDHASGSTSQASNIMEAVDCGAKLLLIDEDRSATNFMIRDSKMKALIKREPITPFTDRVRELSENGVSTILVIGGSGEYLGVSDKVYLMDEYKIHDVTERAAEIWNESDSEITEIPQAMWTQSRILRGEGFSSYPESSRTERLEVSDMGFIIVGDEKIDVRGLYNLVSDSQRSGLAFIIRQLMITKKPGRFDLDDELDRLYEKLRREGVHSIYTSFFSTMELFLDLPRKQEVKAAISRMRRTSYSSADENQI